ncbi:hypothetical protein [Pseudomonas fildesensis]|uniref:hypothetical protein n=1 Tax=Pseudomonas fildesensis TaxID=1674920 RepID=UPI00065FDCA3|nr:hypothetical protein [Pseudomonas fildesensis]
MIHSSHVSLPRQLPPNAVPEAPVVRRIRSVEHESDPVKPTGDSAQAEGDSALAALFAQALRSAQGSGQLGDIDNIPPTSAFGQWWSHLHNAMKSPHFVVWATSQGIDLSKAIEINPGANLISAMVGGQRKSFSAYEHGHLWTSMMAPIMQAANALTTHSGYIYSPTSSTSAPYRAVADFYGEAINDQSRDSVAARAAALEQTQAFVAPLPSPERSEEVLQHEQAKLADVHDQREVALKLVDVILSVDEVSETLLHRTTLQRIDALYLSPEHVKNQLAQVIHSELSKASITLHAGSSSRALQEGPTVGLEKVIGDNGWDVPKSRDELLNLGRFLTTPQLSRLPHGNFGGALSWPTPLSDDDRRTLRFGLRDLQNYDDNKGALGYLTQNQSFPPYDLNHPAQFVQALLATPKAQALGLALQGKFNGVSTPESINDWTLAALGATLDKDSESGSTSAPVRTGVAGFDMARYEHWGQHPSTVVVGLTRHLVAKGHASVEMAPIAAHLLLSRRAPAFLVKEIPGKVTYGSHTWVSFSTAVARLESQAPGSTARMTFAQVVQRADLAPVTEQERQVEQMAQRDALKDWGVANGVIPLNTLDDYTDEQMSRAFEAFNAQVTELSEASQAHSTPIPDRKEMALGTLKRAYGDQIPFEKKCITLVPGLRDNPGPYSVLDLYLADNFRINAGFHWSSSSDDVDIRQIVDNSHQLPDINERFSTELPQYFASAEKATRTHVKNLIATLPLEDRKNIEHGKITTLEEYHVTQSAFSRVVTETKVPNSLLVKTALDGVVNVYEINLKENSIRQRDALRDFPSGPRTLSDGHSRYSTMLKEIEPSGSYSSDVTDEKIQTSTPNSYASEKTGYIADAMVKTVGIRDLEEAKGATTFDTEVPFYKKAREFMANLIPLRSAIQNFQAGNMGDGIVDLTLDAFGFVLGIGVAAKGAKAFQAGVSFASKLARGAKIIGRAAIGSLNPLDGVDGIVRGFWNSGRKALGMSTRSVDLIGLAKRADVVDGTYKLANRADDIKTLAKFDDETGKWFNFDPITNKSYGRPLENFAPETSQWVDDAAQSALPAVTNKQSPNLLDTGLAHDNVVRMGGPMKDLKLIAPEIHVFTDSFKGTTRLNIVAHGVERDWVDKFLGKGTQVCIDNQLYDPKGVIALLKSKGVDPSTFDNVRLLICHSAEGTRSKSFASLFQQEIKKPVKAFEGTLSMTNGSTSLTSAKNDMVNQINNIAPGTPPHKAERLAEIKMQQDFIGKVTTQVLKDHGKKILVNVAGVGEPPKHILTTINYQARQF